MLLVPFPLCVFSGWSDPVHLQLICAPAAHLQSTHLPFLTGSPVTLFGDCLAPDFATLISFLVLRFSLHNPTVLPASAVYWTCSYPIRHSLIGPGGLYCFFVFPFWIKILSFNRPATERDTFCLRPLALLPCTHWNPC